mmetsp:Transcript_6618/g.14145  ORF Transcript_6618/g.14145 Transcript_6618/m.14145 type:complete len:130 (-) Transcript_6618:722-1111(-)
MFFFVPFVASYRKAVDRVVRSSVRRCVRCKMDAAMDEVTVSSVLRLFFVPVWRSSAHEHVLMCRSCGYTLPYSHSENSSNKNTHLKPAETPDTMRKVRQCDTCGLTLNHDWRYCPRCGAPRQHQIDHEN